MKEQNKNFLFNVGYQILMYAFPLITSAYLSRVLGAEKIGIYSYVNSIVTIFGLFGLLGISNYGNREVAKVKDNRSELSSVFSSIYSLQIILSLSVFFIYTFLILVVPFSYKNIFVLNVFQLLSVVLDVSWLFFGLEKFKLTLSRNFFVKVISMVLIVILVKSPSDLWIYTLIMTLSSLISQFVLLVISKKYVDFKFSDMNQIKKHIKGSLILFIPVLAFSIYRIMDKTMIGAISTKAELGFYENAERIINIPIMVISALGTVMLPHMTYTIHNKVGDFKKTIRFSMKLALNIAVFSSLGLIVVGKDLSLILFGNEYEYSGVIIQILSCTIIASAWANVIRTQYLIPMGKDSVYVISTLLGSIVNLILNIIFIKNYGAIGACIGTIVAEFTIVIYQTVFVFKDLDFNSYLKDFFIIFLKSVVTMLFICIVGKFINNMYLRIIFQLFIALLLFLVLNKKFIINEFFGLSFKRQNVEEVTLLGKQDSK